MHFISLLVNIGSLWDTRNKIVVAKGKLGLYNIWRILRKFERASVAIFVATDAKLYIAASTGREGLYELTFLHGKTSTILCAPDFFMCIDDVAI